MRSSYRPLAAGLVALVLALTPGQLLAQRKAPPISDNQVYLGATGGVYIFETARQTRGGIGTAGGQLLINLNRFGLMFQVLESFGGGAQSTSFFDPNSGAAGGTRQVGFHDIRIYNAMAIVTPIRSFVQPYFGAGFAYIQVVNPFPTGPFANQLEQDITIDRANRVGNFGAGSFLAGLQFRVDRFSAFGQAQVYTAAPKKTIFDLAAPDSLVLVGEGRLLEGPSFGLTVGLRVGLGGARSSEAIKD